ncbi:MAG: SxtJ family membrane protein [Candidatus Omnitrophica bacterium]|nr:SxtJ family membrane protein [Candidatus Omnitrophota bacterium]MDD5652646.1 SxtJ family membrane protein [Candidatus Omnitrophota bacterium]
MDKLNFDKKSLKNFGLTMGVAFVLITALVFWKHRLSPLPFGLIAAVFLFLGFFLPAFLKPVYIAWMKLAFILGWINTRLILILLFYLVFFPVSLILRISGKDPLELKIEENKDTYWKKREQPLSGKEHFKRQF